VRLGRRAGLTDEEIARVTGSGDALDGFSAREAAMLAAADELHATRDLSDEHWAALRAAGLSDKDLIELCLLIGHYEMLAMTLNALRVQPE
jgi:alkylhydroperoxidase family enzyme